MATLEQDKYQVSITNDPKNPPALDMLISWQEDTKSFTETRKYPSPQELISQVGREKLLRTVELYAGGILVIAGLGEGFVASALLGNSPPLQIGAFVLGIGTFAAGFFIGRDGSLQSDKISAVHQQVNKVLRPVYTNSSIPTTPPQP